MTLGELKPGQYGLTISDGENDLMTNIDVASKEAAKHAFIFHYGAVQLSSTPAGATVVRKGKRGWQNTIGTKPHTRRRNDVELRLQDYVSTNYSIQTVEGVTNQLSAKLISKRYLQAMKQAHEAFGAGQFDESQKFLVTALEIQPNDSSAMQLRDEVSTAAAKAEEAVRTEQANARAQMLASLTWLDFQNVIADCTDTKLVQYPVQFNDGYYANRGKFHVTGQHTEMRTNTEYTFNPTKFSANYAGRTFRFNCPGNWSVSKVGKDGGIMLKQTRGLFGSTTSV